MRLRFAPRLYEHCRELHQRAWRTKCERKISSVGGRLCAGRAVTTLHIAGIDGKVLQRMLLARTRADRSPRIAAAFSMVQESAYFPGKCTIAVQFAAASITSVFRKQSVVKDRFSRRS